MVGLKIHQKEIISKMLKEFREGNATRSDLQFIIDKMKQKLILESDDQERVKEFKCGIKILENEISSEKNKIILKSAALTIAIPTLTGAAALGSTIAIGAGMAGIFTALGFPISAFALSAPLIISATAFLTSNPIGWGILIGVGILSIGVGIYYGQQKFFNNATRPKSDVFEEKGKIHNTIATFKEKIFGSRDSNAPLEVAGTPSS